MNIINTLQTDILVIGGGLAGITAATTAATRARKVILVSKEPIGYSGNSLVTGAGISVATQDHDNTVAAYYDDLLKSGKGLANEKLVRKLAAESFSVLQAMQEVGVKFVYDKNGSLKVRKPPGHSVARNFTTDWNTVPYQNRGLTITLPFLQKLTATSTQLLEKIKIIKLLHDEHGIRGALGVDRQKKYYHFITRRIILATGGTGFIFAKTNNTSDAVGDGLALALEAGCRLQDMEQIQFYPTMMFEPEKIPIAGSLFGEGAILLNKNKEAFMARYDAQADMATRDKMAQAIFLEIQQGRGIDGCVYMDCQGINKEKLQARFANLYKELKRHKLDLTQNLIRITPAVHFTLGGVVIDEKAYTGVPGLYAAGEICGGVHGANRLAGAALVEAYIFGKQAGISASENFGHALKIHEPEVLPDKLFALGQAQLTKEFRTAMWKNVSLIRSEHTLLEMQEYINSLKAALHASRQRGLILTVAEAIVESALLRKESRGAHYRSDYPNLDTAFNGNIQCWLEDGELQYKFRKKVQ